MMETATRATGSAHRILDLAERLIQVRGYNGFSYADIAEAMQVTKASLHYHFPSKAELGRSLMARYSAGFQSALADIDGRSEGAARKLTAYVGLYTAVLVDGRMCLCGMLAAEFATLPVAMQAEVIHFFDVNEAWLTAVLDRGRRVGAVAFEGSASEAARLLLASLEGAMMLARSYHDVARFEQVGRRLIAGFVPDRRPRTARVTKAR